MPVRITWYQKFSPKWPHLTDCTKQNKTLPDRIGQKSVAVRVGPFWLQSGIVQCYNNIFTLWAWKLSILHKKKLIGYCKPTNFCGRGDRIWTCDLLVPKNRTCVRRSPVISCIPALKPDKNGGNRTDLGCFWGCRLYYELSRNHIGLGSVMIPYSDR